MIVLIAHFTQFWAKKGYNGSKNRKNFDKKSENKTVLYITTVYWRPFKIGILQYIQ